MSSLRVVLVEPKNEGNVGAIARVMKNFGVEDLFLVRPCPLGAEARQRAMHGVDVLGSARTVPDIEEATADVDLLLATIPASKSYPILNVSHAAAILLYELHAGRGSRTTTRPASGAEKERLHEAFGALMASTDYPDHKRARTKVMFRRLLGRAVPT